MTAIHSIRDNAVLYVATDTVCCHVHPLFKLTVAVIRSIRDNAFLYVATGTICFHVHPLFKVDAMLTW